MVGSGNVVVFCTYDAWGNILDTSGDLAATLGKLNPLRYRGYVYNTETQLYYLQSRYYNPTLGRFLNADALVSTGQGLLGNNIFAYCGNNPIMCIDPTGEKHIWVQLFEDCLFGFIHGLVEYHTLWGSLAGTMRREVAVTGGRVDLHNAITNEIWEIKHGGNNDVLRQLRIAEATAQVGKYVSNNPEYITGAAGRFQGEFGLYFDGISYTVKYDTPAPGVVLYRLSIDRKPKRQWQYEYVYAMAPALRLPIDHVLVPEPTGAFIMFAFGGAAIGAVREIAY